MSDFYDNQGRNRPATTSEKRISAALCVIIGLILLAWGMT